MVRLAPAGRSANPKSEAINRDAARSTGKTVSGRFPRVSRLQKPPSFSSAATAATVTAATNAISMNRLNSILSLVLVPVVLNGQTRPIDWASLARESQAVLRSEERRVGKE